MKAVMGPADRVIAVGAGPAPRNPGKRRDRPAVQTERRLIMGASLPARRAIRLPRSCAAMPDTEDHGTQDYSTEERVAQARVTQDRSTQDRGADTE